MEIRIVKDYQAMSKAAAEVVKEIVKESDKPLLGLATGSTPVGLYKELVAMYEGGEIDFSKTRTINLDEYIGLDGTHPQSYRHFMNDTFFNHINIDKKNTYIPDGNTEDHAKECEDYEKLMAQLGQVDLQILGIGSNGHIGFNEPAEKLSTITHVVDLAESTVEANARFFETKEEVPKTAITMGIGSIMRAKKIILLASGSGKAEIMKGAKDDYITTEVPASLLKLHPNVIVIMDEDAAKLYNE